MPESTEKLLVIRKVGSCPSAAMMACEVAAVLCVRNSVMSVCVATLIGVQEVYER